MLTALHVRDFVLIDNLELRLEPGFNVLTGETGAGKSIVIGALDLVLGGRARADVVRPGASEAVVEALFDAAGAADIAAKLDAAGIPIGDELLIRRVVQKNGRSRAYVNGRLCTIAELSALAPSLADITSQHESVALTDARRHIDYLDRYANILALREELAALVDDLHAVLKHLGSLREREKSRAEREAFLRFSLAAIEELQPQAGELEELRSARSRLKHAARLAEITGTLAADLEGDGGLCDRLGSAAAALRGAAELDGELSPAAADMDECWARMREVARAMVRYAERIEAEPARLEEVQDRIYRLEGLLRQHGPTLDEVLGAEQRMTGEVRELQGMEAQIPAFEERRVALHERAAAMARRLAKRRRKVADQLGKAISAELGELGMGAARVLVEVSPSAVGKGDIAVDGARLGRDGIDCVQFLIAPNRGSEPRPLARIASGGELSRALLALKRALCSGALGGGGLGSGGLGSGGLGSGGVGGNIGVQVFDEVDSGVGGDTAARIGRAMADIARHRQVLCVTHMASIAACANAHFVVAKSHGEAVTTSSITRVEGDERVREIARMLTGAKLTATSQRAARELLSESHAA